MNGSAQQSSTTRDGALWVLVSSGLLGFWIGITGFRNWQVAVETAQVVAGLVTYPADNPFYIYHLKLWTVVHEILAVLLRLGVSEIALSEIVSGVLGMVSLQALSMFVYAFSRGAVYSIGAAFVIFLSRAAEFGGTYPVNLMGTTHTYGILGLSSLVLAAALLGAGRYRLGGLLLGALPAIHPSIGVWLAVIVAIAIVTDFKQLKVELRPALPWFLAGCGLAAVSLFVHLAIAADVRPVHKLAVNRYLPALVTFWDGHRRPAHLHNPAVYLNFGVLPLAVTWLLFLADKLPRASVFLLRVVMVSACLAIAFIFVSWIPPSRLPGFLQILMPLRLLNIVGMTFVALLFGLIGAYRRTVPGQLAALLLLIALLLADRSQLWRLLPEAFRTVFAGTVLQDGLSPLRVMAIATAAFTVYALVAKRWERGPTSRSNKRRAVVAIGTLRTALVGALILYCVPALRITMPRTLQFRDRTNDPLFAAAAAGDGLLMTGNGLHLVQLRTRRPVLLDGGGLDGLMYSLEAGPAMNRILRDVYGVDLLRPGDEGRWTGTIPPATNRRAWETYSLERWREIRQTYNVTQVLTEQGWRLDLPLVVENEHLQLYQIPN